MLQAIYPSPIALSSPCGSCGKFGKSTYPDCCGDCNLVNLFLTIIGDIPHKPQKREDLSKLFPPQKMSPPVSLTTVEQCQEAAEIIKQLNSDNGKTAVQISSILNVNVSVIRSLIRGVQKRTSVENYQKIMRYGLNNAKP